MDLFRPFFIVFGQGGGETAILDIGECFDRYLFFIVGQPDFDIAIPHQFSLPIDFRNDHQGLSWPENRLHDFSLFDCGGDAIDVFPLGDCRLDKIPRFHSVSAETVPGGDWVKIVGLDGQDVSKFFMLDFLNLYMNRLEFFFSGIVACFFYI